MKTLPLTQHRDLLLRHISRLQRGQTPDLGHLEALLSDVELICSLDDETLKGLILVVKHHRPDLALNLLTHIKTPKERQSLGNCLADLWGRIDINAAWRAISTSNLPQAERLALQSAMV